MKVECRFDRKSKKRRDDMTLYSGILFFSFIFLLFAGCKKEDGAHSGFLSIHETQCVKGLLAFEVLLCHIYGFYHKGIAMYLFNRMAYISVAMFFLFSGYGLVHQAGRKEDYLKSFLPRRLSKLYIPLWLSLVVSALIYALLGVERDYSAETIVKDILGLNAIWFFFVIVCYYIAFYFVWRITKGKHALGILAVLVVLQCVLCAALRMDQHYFTSSFGFVLGMLLAEHQGKNSPLLPKLLSPRRWNRYAMLVPALILVICGVVYWKLHESVFAWQLLCRNLVGIMIVFIILVFLYHHQIGNKATELLGSISYEIFLIHPAWILSVGTGYTASLPSGVQVALIIGLTILSSCILHRIGQGILRRML